MRLSTPAVLAVLALATATPVPAQTLMGPAARTVVAPAAADVASSDAIVAALYAVISGDTGVPRDWNRFRSLFHPSAKLIPIAGPPITGSTPPIFTATFMSPDDYIARAEPFLMRGFHEREVARRVETFGHMTHVFSTYESRHAATDETPFARGINSIQLFNDGTRWWIISVYWQGETPTIQLPAGYLPTSSGN